jgi:hypothetical protein
MISFSLDDALNILSRTPKVMRAWLTDLPGDFPFNNEGPDTWSPFDVMGHLIHGERTDWIERANRVLGKGPNEFNPFDREAQFKESEGKTLGQLLDEFESVRQENLAKLKAMNIQDEDLDKTGIHPEFGEVTLRQLLSTWVAHDHTHIAQIARVIGKQYLEEVGPWKQYLGIMNR